MTGEQLKIRRIALGITQQRLGEMLGYKGKSALVTVQRWEYGTRPIPVKHYRQLAAILRIDLDDIVP